MLALSRKAGQSIVIAGRIKLTVVAVGGGKVRLAFEAPAEVRIDRAEVAERHRGNNSALPLPQGEVGVESPLS